MSAVFRRARLAVVLGMSASLASALPAAAGDTVVWRVDSVTRIGGHAVTLSGTPRVVATDIGPAVAFDGAADGLFIEANPLAGLPRFTIDLVFQPAPDGAEEQRILHVEETGGIDRALLEIRQQRDGAWALDTYLRSGEERLTLLDRRLAHPAARWHVATLTYDGTTMTHFVDGVREQSGAVAFAALAAGRTSIGVRLNRVSWFKGLVHSIRFTPRAREPEIPLWPEGVPNARAAGGAERLEDGRVSNVQTPTLTYVPPAAAPNGTAVIIGPGGGYGRLAMTAEPPGLAERLARAGVASFVLKYRLKEYGFPAPLQDVLRAVRLLRSRAAEFDLRADRIGLIGVSAGGHVAGMAATLFDAPEGRTGAALDAISGRPDFVALLYPVITMHPPFAHADSVRNLAGAAPTAALLDRLSLERQARRDMPPVFLVHTAEDGSVPFENSVRFHDAVRKAGGQAELHLYDRGPHGFGTRSDLGTTSGWVERWVDWMRAHGWLPDGERSR
jgi:acetyl esterase/lipase